MTAGIDWPGVWSALADAMRSHVDLGRRHLLTEDVVRFAVVAILAEEGVTADRLAVERTVAGVGRIDLVVDPPSGVAVEFKFPREPQKTNAADTEAFGQLLKDLYRLAQLDVVEAWAVQLIRPSLSRYLARRTELTWTNTAGQTLHVPARLADALPQSARAALGAFDPRPFEAHCAVAEPVGEDVLAAYLVQPPS